MSPSFASTLKEHEVHVLGNAPVVIGTAMLGDDFGAVKRASLQRTAEREEIKDDAGELRVLLLLNPGFTMTLEVAFDLGIEAPGLLEEITLPFLNLKGRVMEGVAVAWEDGAERGLSIPIAQWDCMEEDGEAYSLNLDGSVTIITGPWYWAGGARMTWSDGSPITLAA